MDPSLRGTMLTISVGKLGYYLPWGIFCGVFTATGAGLVSMWTPTTSVARWIGYQIVFGAGRGAGMQVVSSLSYTVFNPGSMKRYD